MPSDFSIVRLESPEGTTVFDLAGGDTFIEEGGWSPAETFLDPARRSNRNGFADVKETMTLNFAATNAATLSANRAKLTRLMTQARRWARGENVNPILLAVQIQGSDTLLKTPILGLVGEAMVQNPTSLTDYLMINEVNGAQLSFLRKGLWYETINDSFTTAAIAPAVKAEFAMPLTAPSIPSPTYLNISSIPLGTEGYILLGNGTNPISFIEPPNLINAGVGAGTPISDAYALGGTYISYGANNLTSGVGTFDYGRARTGLPPFTQGRRQHVFVSCRATGSSYWKIYALPYVEMNRYGGTRHAILTNVSSNPQIVYLGTMSSDMIYQPTFWAEIIGTSRASTDQFHIDYIVTADADETNIVKIAPNDPAFTIFGDLTIDPSVFTHVDPRISGINGAITFPYNNYRGNLSLSTTSASLEGMFLATQGANWRPQVASAVVTHTWNAQRRRAHITLI